MSKGYTFDPRNWPSIAGALATAYADFLDLQGDVLRAKPPEPSLTQRVRAAFAGLDPFLQELRNLSAQGNAVTLEQEREKLEARLASAQDVPDIEQICDETLVLLENGRKATEEIRKRRDELAARLQQTFEDLERRAPDSSLSALRSELSKKAKQILGKQPLLLTELEDLQRGFESYRTKARESLEKLQTNIQDASRLRQQLQARRTRLDDLEKQAAALEGEPGNQIRDALGGIRQQLDDFDTQIGDEKKHPNVPPDEREKQLITVRRTLDTLSTRLQELSRRMQAPRKAPGPKPPQAPPPTVPLGAVEPQPSTGGMTSGPPPSPSASGPLPVEETQRTETPAPTATATPGVYLPAPAPPFSPGLPAAGNEPMPATAAPVPPPASSVEAPQQPNAPAPEPPKAPPAPQPTSARQRRTVTFLPTPEGLRALAEFLDTQPHIVDFTFAPPLS
jgi:hypothetical protein